MPLVDILRHPVAMLIIALLIVFRIFAGKTGPMEHFEGEVVTEIDSTQMYNTLVAEAKEMLLVVDAYATWCGPCRTASPIFGKLSTEYDSSTVR